MQYNSLGVAGFAVVAPHLSRFRSLTGLDLSCNKLDLQLMNSDNVADLLGNTLAELPVLSRLDLSNNDLESRLGCLLRKMPSALSHLELSACGLSENDLAFLTNSHHANHIKVLDISENNLGSQFQHFLALLRALKTLVVLETENCSLQQCQLTSFSKAHQRNLGRYDIGTSPEIEHPRPLT